MPICRVVFNVGEVLELLSVLRRLFKKETAISEVSPMPSREELVAALYAKGLDALMDEVVEVVYSKDRSMRYVVTKDDKGLFRVVLESIYVFDEDEWNYTGRENSGELPAMWIEHPDAIGTSIFDTKDTALREMRAEHHYQQFFA